MVLHYFIPSHTIFSKWDTIVPFSDRVDCGCHIDKCNMASHFVHFELLSRNSQEAVPFKENEETLMLCQGLHFWKIEFSWQIQEAESLAFIRKHLPCSITKAIHAWHQMEPLFSSDTFNHKPNHACNLFWRIRMSLLTTAWLSFQFSFFAAAAFFGSLKSRTTLPAFFLPYKTP